MSRSQLCFVTAALLAADLVGCDPPAAGSVGLPATDFEVATLNHVREPRFITSMRGDAILLNVWATWCTSCREELPSLQRLHDDYVIRGLSVVAVNVDGPGSEPVVQRFIGDYGLTIPVRITNLSRARSALSLQGLPTTLLIDRHGVIQGRYFARDWTTNESRALVLRLLSERPGRPE